MPQMIPPEIPDDAPESEKIIFKNLMHAPQARDWIVFHSNYVENPKNPTRPREIDFIIVIPDSCVVICLEVKGGSYRVRNGQWYRLPSNERVGSPMDQARTAMFALKNEFSSSHFNKNSVLSLGCAVILTDGEIPTGSQLANHIALLIESRDARDPSRLCKVLKKYADKLPLRAVSERLSNPMTSQFAQVKLDNLRRELEPPDMTITTRSETIFRSDLETLHPQLLRLTTDQLNSLKRVRLNDRCVIDGAAGTGKTVLAMELAKQRCEEGKSVALLCSNPYLSLRFMKWANTLSSESGGRIMAGTPATLPSIIFSEDNELLAMHLQRLKNSPRLEQTLKLGYLDDGWQQFIEDTVEDLEQDFDYLIVDEAQNLCNEVFLGLMNALLKGGLVNGRWTMFGDFTNQNIVSPDRSSNGTDALKHFGLNWSNDVLETNCRNTHEIAEAVAKFVDIDSPPISGVHGPLVQIEYFNSEIELEEVLDRLIESLKSRDFLSRQVILLNSNSTDFNAARPYGGWELLNIRESQSVESPKDSEDVLVLDQLAPDNILKYSDVYDFQGLESEVAILVLPVSENQTVLGGGVILPHHEHLRRILYTGMSRAKTMLIVVANESYKDFLEPPGL